MRRPDPVSRGAGRTVIRGARCALGPRESALVSIEIIDGCVTYLETESCASSMARLGQAEIDLSGFLVMPGLINAHDHLQFALHPRVADPPYRNYVDWGEDIHAKFPNVLAKHRAVPKAVRLWWGGLRNLLCGVTTVSHHDQLWPELQREEFPVRVVQDCGWGHSLELGGDLREARATTPEGSAFILHACEGVDEQTRAEIFKLDALGLLDARTVLVHGLAVDVEGVELMRARGTSLIICPSSNNFLFGRMPDVTLFRAIGNVALGSDSPLTSEGDLMDEVRFAIRYCGIAAEAAYHMITDVPAAMLGLGGSEGTIKVAGRADLTAVRDNGRDAAERLRTMSIADVELVMIGGRVQLASEAMFARISTLDREGMEPLWIDGIVRWLRAPVKAILQSAEDVLGAGNVRLGGRPVRIPEILEAGCGCSYAIAKERLGAGSSIFV
jgi:cytosine/adenosine deaminase-related metal-dependent hydrolase